MGGDKAGFGSTSWISRFRSTTATRNNPTVGNNRPRTMGAGIDLVVENLSFPNGFTGLGIQCKYETVIAGVDDQILKDC